MRYKYLVAAALQEELHEFIVLAGGLTTPTLSVDKDYEEVTCKDENLEFKVAVFSPDKMGMPYNAAKLMEIIYQCSPEYVLFIGTCAGFGKHEFGTVLVPISAFAYESGKYSNGVFRSDFISYEFGDKLRREAAAFALHRNSELKYQVITDEHICSGAAVIDDENKVKEIINHNNRKLAGLEMEGFAIACINQIMRSKCELLVVKGVSDKAFNKQQSEQEEAKTIAKQNSAHFVHQFLCHLEKKYSTQNTNQGKNNQILHQSFENTLHNMERAYDWNIIYKNRLLELRRIHQDIKDGKFSLSYRQMEQYTSDSIRELLRENTALKTYYTTHLVNDQDKYRLIWESDSQEENDRDDFVKAQRELLNNGGEVIRLFIFHRPYFLDKKKECLNMLKTHNSYYRHTKKQIQTLIHLYHPKNKLEFNQDFSLVGGKIVFEWNRSVNDNKTEYSDGICNLNGDHYKIYNDRFEKYKSRSESLQKILQDESKNFNQ